MLLHNTSTQSSGLHWLVHTSVDQNQVTGQVGPQFRGSEAEVEVSAGPFLGALWKVIGRVRFLCSYWLSVSSAICT